MEVVICLTGAIFFFLGLESFEMLKDPENSRPVCVALSIAAFTACFWSLGRLVA